MTSSRQRDPPRRGYTVAVEEIGGSWRVPLSRFLAGVPRDWMALRPGRHRDARFRSIILTAESMISSLRRCARASAIAKSTRAPVRSPFFLFPSFPPFPFFFSLLQSGHRCSQTTAAGPPGCSKPIEQKITYSSSALVATQSSRMSHPAGLLTKCQRILYPKLLHNTIDTALWAWSRILEILEITKLGLSRRWSDKWIKQKSNSIQINRTVSNRLSTDRPLRCWNVEIWET